MTWPVLPILSIRGIWVTHINEHDPMQLVSKYDPVKSTNKHDPLYVVREPDPKKQIHTKKHDPCKSVSYIIINALVR